MAGQGRQKRKPAATNRDIPKTKQNDEKCKQTQLEIHSRDGSRGFG